MAKTAPFKPTLVHAYRRLPHMKLGANGVEVEQEVEVVFDGEKVKFKSNEAGHVVALVSKESTYKRLVEEISEAYIPYANGDNIPERKADTAPTKPDGVFVLQADDGAYLVLDTMEDDALRAFATEAQIEDDALPAALTGDTLRRAIYNLLNAA